MRRFDAATAVAFIAAQLAGTTPALAQLDQMARPPAFNPVTREAPPERPARPRSPTPPRPPEVVTPSAPVAEPPPAAPHPDRPVNPPPT